MASHTGLLTHMPFHPHDFTSYCSIAAALSSSVHHCRLSLHPLGCSPTLSFTWPATSLWLYLPHLFGTKKGVGVGAWVRASLVCLSHRGCTALAASCLGASHATFGLEWSSAPITFYKNQSSIFCILDTVTGHQTQWHWKTLEEGRRALCHRKTLGNHYASGSQLHMFSSPPPNNIHHSPT